MKKLIASLLAVSALVSGCGNSEEADLGYSQVSSSAAMLMMEESEGYIILDVRTAEEYAEKHIAGAINVPNESIGDSEIAELPDKAQQIFVYCRSGNRSKQASAKLVKLGYTNIVEFGGINEWSGATE